MARPEKETPRVSRLGPALLRRARDAGVDVALLSARLALPPDASAREDIAVTSALLAELFEALEDALSDPFVALRLPRELASATYDLPELAARSSPDLGSALARLAAYASLMHPFAEAAFEDGARLVMRAPRMPRGLGRHANEYLLAYALTHVRATYGAEVRPDAVWFQHARPKDLAPLYDFFGTRELAFGAADSGMSFAADALARTSPSFDARLLATVEAMAKSALATTPNEAAFAPLLAQRLADLLPDDADIEHAARALHMSPRTLQRRLEDEGARFTEVLDRVRRDLAFELLGSPEAPSLGEVTHRLGFSDLATFSRAFKRWTGKPPGAYRRSRPSS